MYCNYYKREDGTREWFSIDLDNDETGIEILTIMKNTIKKNLTEAVNLDQFKKAEELLDMADDIEKALRQAQAHDEKAE